MKINIISILLFASIMCQAQTKLIAHKSHSGSKHSFAKAYQNDLFDVNCSNFGGPFTRPITVVDTIMAVNDSVTIVKVRESTVCYPFGTDYRDIDESDFKRKTHTLINHKLFNKNNSVEFIKCSRENSRYFYEEYKYIPMVKSNYTRIPRRIVFSNPIKKIVFIGFKE